MKPIDPELVQEVLNHLTDTDLYIHLETTNGAYTEHSFGAYIRNAVVRFDQGRIRGTGPYRVGLKMAHGWIFAEGLTDWEMMNGNKRLLLAGHDKAGKLTVALQLSPEPF